MDNLMDKRRRILHSAARCFLQYGFANTSIDQVAEDSGAVKQTVYNYFEGKDLLFLKSIEHLLHDISFPLDETWYELAPEEFFFKLGQLQLKILRDRRTTDLLRLAVREFRKFPQVQVTYSRAIPEPIITFIARYIKAKGNLPEDTAELTAWCYRAALAGYATRLNLGPLKPKRLPEERHTLRYMAGVFARALTSLKSFVPAPFATKLPEALPSLVDDSDNQLRKLLAINLNGARSAKNLAILIGAMKAFALQGFAETTMDQVARLAGVSKQTVYTNFKSKEGLFSELCREFLAGLQNLSTFSPQQSQDCRQFLSDFYDELSQRQEIALLPEFLRTLLAESHDFPVEVATILLHLYESNREVLEEYLRNKMRFDPVSSLSMSVLISSVLSSYMLFQQVYRISDYPCVTESNVIAFAEVLMSC